MPVIQANHQVAVTCALGPDVLLFRSMSAAARLGRLPETRLQLLSLDPAVNIADVLGKPLGVSLKLTGDAGERHFHGIVTRFGSTGHGGGFASYEAVVHPWLWLLKKSADCRIFQDKSVPDIVKEVCSGYGGQAALDIGGLTGDYAALPYCVQYRETDFDFVCRLLEEAGIYFYFTHTADSHTMVLADAHTSHTLIDGYGALKFASGQANRGVVEESVSSWTAHGEIQPSSVVLNDYNYEKSGSSLSGGTRATAQIEAGFGQADYEIYDYPGRYAESAQGNGLAKGRLQRLHGQTEEIAAVTDARGMFAGGLFALDGHAREDQNRKYLVTGTQYEISGGAYASGIDKELEVVCRLNAIGHSFAYRPPAICARPVIHGPQTAIVVGKAGEEIWTDKYGRIKVQFHWDRLGKDDENSSCWVRVAQGWAGKGWGAMALPRIGMEVVVSFLEGDPDRPLVTGCVYNSDAMPPYPLPAEQTRSTIKSQSSKGGEGFNELRFEDKKGAEEVFMHAERDFLRVVKNNDALKVGFETADKGDQTIDIKNDQTETIGNNQSLTVKADQTVDVNGKQAVKVGTTIVIEAGTSIELKVGGSSIKIEAAKITIKSPEVEIAADANAKLKASAMMDIKSGAVMTIGGALVQIN
jgi:type VI secretion system secreted protein VgrG